MDQAIIIDNGTEIKAGIAGDFAPKVAFPSIVGHQKTVIAADSFRNIITRIPIRFEKEQKAFYIGNEIKGKWNSLDLKYPIEQGIVTNWEDMERIWHHTFYNELEVSPSEHPVLLTDAIFNPKNNREKMAQIMFEKFNVPAFYVSISALLSLCSAGRSTGIVIDSGDGASSIVPIYDGSALPYATQRFGMAGIDLTWNMLSKVYSLENLDKHENARYIKENFCYVALDFNEEIQKARNSVEILKYYKMPDGSTVTLGNERFNVPEALFQPSLLGSNIDGIGEATYKSIMACNLEIRDGLFGNVFMSGGSTMFPGIAERLNAELIAKAPPSMNIKVIAPPERRISTWLGGSILASLNSFQEMWITKTEYDEVGVGVIHHI